MSAAQHALVPRPRSAVPPSAFGRRPGRPNAPVWAAAGAALAAGLGWAVLYAGVGGDLAAQWAWADFVARHPGAAYDLAWYGGLHPASYSLLSPYLMAVFGVRTVAVLSDVAAAALLARLLVRAGVRRPMPAALWGAFALTCDVVAGRVTFALGCAFGLAALVAAGPDRSPPHRRTPHYRTPRRRTAAAAGCALLAALASPVAGLFVEVAAAALLLTGRRRTGLALALPLPVVLAVTGVLFPFRGIDPIAPTTVAMCLATVAGVLVLAPPGWRAVRAGAVVYGIGAVATGVLATPVGANVQRLGLLFGAVVLLAVRGTAPPLPGRSKRLPPLLSRRRGAVLLAACAASAWWTVAGNLVGLPAPSSAHAGDALVAELRRLGADRGRVEAVPMLNHWESWGLAGTVELARGWNRQADLQRNPLFYEGTLTPDRYRDWLRRWAVGYVVLPSGTLDYAARQEAAVIGSGPDWLREVWHDDHWRLYRFTDAVPLALPLTEPPPGPSSGPPAGPSSARSGDPSAGPAVVVEHAGPAEVVLGVPAPGPVEVRIPWTRWLAVHGPAGACLARGADGWTTLRAPAPGRYRIDARYSRPGGTPCPAPQPPR
ncbi:MFS transporter [Kitasatospora sp. NPDC059571]|uniref:MFS transporter n=1 Tax=Kitasatospora sp. NPDC059571 TaxID=3346871 RepID=UPI0036BF3AB7